MGLVFNLFGLDLILPILTSNDKTISACNPQPQPQSTSQSRDEKLFFNSLSSELTKTNSKLLLGQLLSGRRIQRSK